MTKGVPYWKQRDRDAYEAEAKLSALVELVMNGEATEAKMREAFAWIEKRMAAGEGPR